MNADDFVIELSRILSNKTEIEKLGLSKEFNQRIFNSLYINRRENQLSIGPTEIENLLGK